MPLNPLGNAVIKAIGDTGSSVPFVPVLSSFRALSRDDEGKTGKAGNDAILMLHVFGISWRTVLTFALFRSHFSPL